MGLAIFVAHPSRKLTDHLPMGDGLAAHALISELASRGHQIHVAVEELGLNSQFPPNVTLHHIGRSRLARRLTYAVKLRRLFNRVSEDVDFDLIHQLNPVDAGLTLLLPYTPPLVLGPYIPPWDSVERKLSMLRRAPRFLLDFTRRIVETLQQRRAAVLLLTSEAARSRVRTPNVETQLLPLGVDTEFFTPSMSGGEPTSSRERILFLANVERRKGIDVLVDAFQILKTRRPGAEMIVAGHGFQSEAIARRVADSEWRDSVIIPGSIPRERVPAMMRECEVYCLPSYGEPFGISALEAMACGKPLVVTRAGGLQFLVDPRGGWLVAPGDAIGLAEVLDESLSDPDRLEAMGRFNRARVERDFSWNAVVDRLEEIYNSLLERTSNDGANP